jgi:hypothetical protein
MALSHFGGMYVAAEFAYGVNSSTPALQVIAGPNTTGSGALTLAFGSFCLADGTKVNAPLNTNAPVIVGGNSAIETVTPSAVSNSTPLVYGSSTLSATFTSLHGNGDSIRSGTVGLQEALNFVGAKGGGIVVVDQGWTNLGGTSAMISAAVLPTNVTIQDNRFGTSTGATSSTTTLTNAQILGMFATPVQLLPAPGANSFYSITKAVYINLSNGTEYTGGGVIEVGYGNPVGQNALSGTLPASFLTGVTSTTAIAVGASTGEINAFINLGIFIDNATAAFAGAGGPLQVTLFYNLITI